MNNCLKCGRETKNPKYCSRSCSAKVTNVTHPKRPLEGSCALCTKPIKSGYKLCPRCSSLTRNYKKDWDNITLEEVVGVRKYQKHSRVRALARNTYIMGKRPSHCEVCGYSKHFEVCHIIAIKDFPLTATISEINSLDNLKGLCPNCHWELDRGRLAL